MTGVALRPELLRVKVGLGPTLQSLKTRHVKQIFRASLLVSVLTVNTKLEKGDFRLTKLLKVKRKKVFHANLIELEKLQC